MKVKLRQDAYVETTVLITVDDITEVLRERLTDALDWGTTGTIRDLFNTISHVLGAVTTEMMEQIRACDCETVADMLTEQAARFRSRGGEATGRPGGGAAGGEPTGNLPSGSGQHGV